MAREKIAVFDGNFNLVAIISNRTQVAKLLGLSNTEVYETLKGKRITCKKYYLRCIPDELMLDVDDLGKNLLLEFDSQCGLDMKIYVTRTQDKRGIILESEFLKLKDNKRKRYRYGKKKYKKKKKK